MDHAAILYVTANATSKFSTIDAAEHPPILGFFFIHPRTFSSFEAYHIYLAAIHPSSRGQGIFPLLLEETKRRASEAGCKHLSIATIPERFSRMYAILSGPSSGWEVIEWEDVRGEGSMKVRMRLSVE